MDGINKENAPVRWQSLAFEDDFSLGGNLNSVRGWFQLDDGAQAHFIGEVTEGFTANLNAEYFPESGDLTVFRIEEQIWAGPLYADKIDLTEAEKAAVIREMDGYCRQEYGTGLDSVLPLILEQKLPGMTMQQL